MADGHVSGCRVCGKPTKQFVSSDRVAKYCSTDCRRRYANSRARPRYKLRKCVQCGDEAFVKASTARKVAPLCKYCTTQKAARIRSEICAIRRKLRIGTAIEARFRKARVAKRKAMQSVSQRRTWKPAMVYTECVVCKTPLSGRLPGTKYCSKDCSVRASGLRKTLHKYAGTIRSCVICGVQWSPLYGGGRMVACGQECADQARRESAAANKARNRVKRKAAEGRHSFRENPRQWYVWAITVFRRDNWRCRSCGCNTPKHLRGSHNDDAPELDHIVPVSKGGAHTLDNLQCLCRLCNLAKGDMDWDRFHHEWVVQPRASHCLETERARVGIPPSHATT